MSGVGRALLEAIQDQVCCSVSVATAGKLHMFHIGVERPTCLIRSALKALDIDATVASGEPDGRFEDRK